jgi:hypothetical protein
MEKTETTTAPTFSNDKDTENHLIMYVLAIFYLVFTLIMLVL